MLPDKQILLLSPLSHSGGKYWKHLRLLLSYSWLTRKKEDTCFPLNYLLILVWGLVGEAWAESCTCSGPFPLHATLFAPQTDGKKTWGQAVGHAPSTSLRRGGGRVCVALIPRKAKHRWPNIAKQWSNRSGWRKEEGVTAICCAKRRKRRREVRKWASAFFPPRRCEE